MLNAGLATLDYLKSRLLPEAGQDETQWDTALGMLGRAVAGQFERHCNRQLARLEVAVDEFSAWTLAVTASRYPLEEIESVEIRAADATTTELEAALYTADLAAGLIEFSTAPGTRRQRLLLTYTGGFWLDDGDPQPAGSTALPDELLEAWVTECQAQAEARGLLEAIGLRAKDPARKPPEGLSPATIEILRGYRRFSGE